MRAPVLAIGDGALGFWKAVRDVFPGTKEQRCWWHKIGNVLAALPKSGPSGAKKALAEIYNAENKQQAMKAAKAFADQYGTKWPKAAAKISDDLDVLLAFYDFPAEHWVHLRTTNPNAPSGNPAVASRSSAGSPARPPACRRSGPCSIGPAAVGAASPRHRRPSASCKTSTTSSLNHPVNSVPAPPRQPRPRPSHRPRNITHWEPRVPSRLHHS